MALRIPTLRPGISSISRFPGIGWLTRSTHGPTLSPWRDPIPTAFSLHCHFSSDSHSGSRSSSSGGGGGGGGRGGRGRQAAMLAAAARPVGRCRRSPRAPIQNGRRRPAGRAVPCGAVSFVMCRTCLSEMSSHARPPDGRRPG